MGEYDAINTAMKDHTILALLTSEQFPVLISSHVDSEKLLS